MATTLASALPQHSSVADTELRASKGGTILAVSIVLIAGSLWLACISPNGVLQFWLFLAAVVIAIALGRSVVILQPNQSVVCLLFGRYVGTERRPGFWLVNPLYSKNKVFRRLETLESGPLKVNDAVGNPIDISAVVVWRVEDGAKALFEVGSYEKYVQAQSETALRRITSEHPYDLIEAEEAEEQEKSGRPELSNGARRLPISAVTLRDGGDAITETLLKELRTRMDPIGVSVVEARISHLAYSSEIAGAMLRKQAAGAVVAARRLVVKGAVSIVEEALKQLDVRNLADALDPERKAAMISNLLVVLVADREVTPVINTGTLYS